MFPPENFQPSWSYYDYINPSLNEDGDNNISMDIVDTNHCELSSIFTTPEDDSLDISFSIPYLSEMHSDGYEDFDQVHMGLVDTPLSPSHLSLVLEELGPILNGEIDDMSQFLQDGKSFSSQQPSIDGEEEWRVNHFMGTYPTSMDMAYIQPSLNFPTEEMDINNPLILLHLVTAYAEAVEKGQAELAEVIVKRICEKVSPVGEITERLLYYLFQTLDKQSDYLKQEAGKNFHAAFKAFYQIFPNGKFAHFAANTAILEAMPHDAEVIHIFDFDLGDGIQWSSMIEAVGCQKRELRLTSIKWSDACKPSQWKFEETKKRLYDHAWTVGLKLVVDEVELHDLMRMKKRGSKREWLAFNCASSLPHMGRVRRRKDIMEFFKAAKEILSSNSDQKGVITLGDGDAWDRYKSCSTFGSFLDGYLVHYQALLESIECNFPIHLGEARIAMEYMFVSPFVSSLAWIRKWEEVKECTDVKSLGFGLEGWRLSRESLMEAKEMVREGDGSSLYGVRVEGENHNEMVLEWNGVGLVRVSCWRS